MFFPDSLRKTDGFIVQAKRILEDIITHNEFTTNDIPFTLTEMLNDAETKQVESWRKIVSHQLTSIFTKLDGIPNLPTQESVENIT